MKESASSCECLPVLVVDDDKVFREALADNLRIDHHEVLVCESACAARAAINGSGGFTVLVTEYPLRGTNGLQLAEEFHSVRAGVALLVTAHASQIQHLEVRGYLRVLPKPVEYETVHRGIHDLIR